MLAAPDYMQHERRSKKLLNDCQGMQRDHEVMLPLTDSKSTQNLEEHNTGSSSPR